MAEYISRETLLKAVEKMDRLDKETNTQYEYDKEGYILLIQNAPTADVEEVKHGEWLYNNDDFTPKMRCSFCGYKKPLIAGENIEQEPNNYCNNCGAKMDKGV